MLIGHIKKAKDKLAWRVYEAETTEAGNGPVFAEGDQVRGSTRTIKRRRPRIQALRTAREAALRPPAREQDAVGGHRGCNQTPTDSERAQQGTTDVPMPPSAPRGVTSQRQGQGVRLRPRGGLRTRGRRAGKNVRRGGQPPFSVAGRQGTVPVFFANVTQWSEHAENYLVGCGDDAVLAAELHVKRRDVDKVLKLAGKNGWNATVGPARQSTKSLPGSNAGVLAQVHGRWRSTPWAECVDQRGHVGPWHNLIGRSATINGIEVQLMSGYFDCQEGLSGTNWYILARVEQVTGVGRDPFVLAVDANKSPEAFRVEAAAWLARNRATIVTASNVQYTCKTAAGGSMLDYFIVSDRVAGLIASCEAITDVPWGPHFGIRLILNARPSEVLTRQIKGQRPEEPPGKDIAPFGVDDANTEALTEAQRAAIWGEAWSAACAAAESVGVWGGGTPE